MAYYNNVIVLFTKNDQIEWRFAGQILPSAAKSQALINFNTGIIVEIINDIKQEEIINFANNLRQNLLSEIHDPENNINYIAPEEWQYIES